MSPSRKSAPSAVVGLDIGTDSIKVAEAKITRDGITITGLGIRRTPQGVIENEVIVDPKALGAEIKALLAESGIKTKRCVSSVSGASQVVVRVISVPKMKPEELAETMKWEVERHVPFSPQEVVMDFQPLEKPDDDPNASEMEVLLAVAQQQLIDSHVEALIAAGLKPMAIDIEPLASSRALVDCSSNGATDETVAVINIGSTHTDLGVFENGCLTFPSPPIGIAGVNFTREISEALGQALEQAEVTKREFAAVDMASFQSAAPVAGQDGAGAGNEQTVFNTSYSSDLGIASAFDMDEPAAPAAEAADPSDFATTADGPVFDIGDSLGGPGLDVGAPAATDGPSFDLGDPAAEQGPSFDIGEPAASAGPTFDIEEPAAASGPAFDLGGDDSIGGGGPSFDLGGGADAPSSGLTFDLSDDEPEEPVEEVAEPSFDLSDAGSESDHGAQAAPEADVQPAAAPAAPMTDGSTEALVFQAISGVLVDLANELRTSIDYYINRYGKSPDRVYLCGGSAKIAKLDEFLSQELGIPVAVADPVKNLPVQVPGASPQYLNEISPLLPVCMGLAIRDMIG